MKNIFETLILLVIIIGMVMGAGAIVNVLTQIITIKHIMTVGYIALGFGIIYILKEV